MQTTQYKVNQDLWDEIVTEGRKNQDNDQVNLFDKDDITTIIATLEFFNASTTMLQQTYYDLKTPKFRFFDYLAMMIQGRNDDDRERNNTGIKVLVYAFRKAKYIPSKMIELLRIDDYQIDTGWEDIKIDQ